MLNVVMLNVVMLSFVYAECHATWNFIAWPSLTVEHNQWSRVRGFKSNCCLHRVKITKHETWCHNTQPNDTQHDDIQHNNKWSVTHSIMTLCVMTECHLCWVSFMMNVTCKPYMVSVVMLNVVMLSVIYAECHGTWNFIAWSSLMVEHLTNDQEFEGSNQTKCRHRVKITKHETWRHGTA